MRRFAGRTAKPLSKIEALCAAVSLLRRSAALEIVTSSLCLVEVLCKNADAGIDDQKVRNFFDNDYILLVAVDKQVGDRARKLMLQGFAKLKPLDAIHAATAAIANADELHTFDERLLAMDNKVDKADGTRLIIKKPAPPAPPAPLLETLERGQG